MACSFAIHFFFKFWIRYTNGDISNQLLPEQYNNITHSHMVYNANLDVYYSPINDLRIQFPLIIRVFVAWVRIYFFLMGFDSTGPFVITIYRIVSKDVPYFLYFYLVVLAAFACALTSLINDGDPTVSMGFWDIMVTFWVLMKFTVNWGQYNFGVDEAYVSDKNVELFDFIQTFFFFIVNILMLNLLIARMSNTYNSLFETSETLLISEKWNIMRDFGKILIFVINQLITTIFMSYSFFLYYCYCIK